MSDVMGDFVKEITERVIKEEARKTALKLILSGKMTQEEIAEILNLPLAEVEELAKKTV